MQITIRQLNQVRGGRKTQIRIPVREPRTVTRKNSTSYVSRPFTPEIGAGMALRAPNSNATPLPVTITDTHKQTLCDITFSEVMAEGHLTTSAFQVWWVTSHDRPWTAKHTDDTGLPDDLALERFRLRHSGSVVWAIRFEIDRASRPRLLTPTTRGPSASDEDSDDAHGYTTNPALALGGSADPGEGIDDDTLRWYTADAHERFKGLPGRREKALNQEAQNLSRRLRLSVRTADAGSLEVAAQLQRIRDEIAALEALRHAA